MLVYRMPREPSRPRIAVWRKLERLGVARLGDGVVALPADARTRQQFDWIADEVVSAGGSCTLWLSSPATPAQEREIATGMRAARAAEYDAVAAEAGSVVPAERVRVVRRLRAEMRRIARRDFFPPPERDCAQAALRALVGGDRNLQETGDSAGRAHRPG
jgi:hypothetical protein